jgi:hypothetical protein
MDLTKSNSEMINSFKHTTGLVGKTYRVTFLLMRLNIKSAYDVRQLPMFTLVNYVKRVVNVGKCEQDEKV